MPREISRRWDSPFPSEACHPHKALFPRPSGFSRLEFSAMILSRMSCSAKSMIHFGIIPNATIASSFTLTDDFVQAIGDGLCVHDEGVDFHKRFPGNSQRRISTPSRSGTMIGNDDTSPVPVYFQDSGCGLRFRALRGDDFDVRGDSVRCRFLVARI